MLLIGIMSVIDFQNLPDEIIWFGQILETIDDMNAYREAGLIDIGIARPMDSDHIVNCPFIDPFQ